MAESLSPAFLAAVRKFFTAPSPLDAIPSVGIPSYPFGFYVGAWNYIKNGRAITEEGYLQYPGKAFKVALANRWLVLIHGRTLIEDVRKAPDEFLSVAEATNSLLHLEHTIGHEQHHDPFQIAVIRSAMTRNIGAGFHDIRNEIMAAFEDLVPAKADGTPPTILPIVRGFSNRFFIGLQCRDPEYIKITTQYAQDVTSNAAWLHVTPAVLRPFAARFFGHLEPATRKALKYLGPLLQHRLDMDDKYGAEWPNDDRPNDMISWLLDEARGYPNRRNVRNLTRTVLNVNFGALHTTTQGVLHALYTLAANLQYVQPLREEIESVLRTEGWSKAGIQKLVKLDSFLKESARFVPGGAVAVLRQVMKDFTFSDGTTVPAGGHHDEVGLVHSKAGEGIKHQMVTPTPDYLSFGLGRHACPGRFFAVNEQKMLLAHILVTYDFKLKDGKRPEDEWMAMVGAANSTAEVMFRRRQ
ncbi:cytochrome P450 [Mycena olivaceomarginata]|nr:cytochrome P450 [Mycena olivaceomarginata]